MKVPVEGMNSVCSVRLLYEDGEAQNGEHFVGYDQNIDLSLNQSFAISMPVFPLFPSEVSNHNRTLSFQAKIGHATCGWNLSGNNYSLVHIDESPEIDSSEHDVIVCSCSTNLSKKELIHHLLSIKQLLAEMLVVARKSILIGKIETSSTQRRLASPQGTMLPMKMLARRGEGHLLMQKLNSLDLGSLIPGGKLSSITVLPRYELCVYCYHVVMSTCCS